MGISDNVPDGRASFVGQGGPLITLCKKRTGRRHVPKLKTLVKRLMKQWVFQYQSLIAPAGGDATTNWRLNGSLRLTSTSVGAVTTFPLVVNWPVYVFRLGVPNGMQTVIGGGANQAVEARPVIGYRLQCTQNSATEPWLFKWVSFNVSQNCIQSPFDSGGTVNQLDIQAMTKGDDNLPMRTSRPVHDWSTVNVLYTDPTQLTSTLVTGIVNFTDKDFAPPDEYLDATTTPVSVNPQVWRANINAADAPSVTENSTFWTKYINDREGHPLRFEEVGTRPKNVFTWHSKKVMVFPPQQNINIGTGTAGAATGLQHVHKETLRPLGTQNTVVERNSELVQGINQQFETGSVQEFYESGIFPAPERQKWFMIQGWLRRGVTAFNASYNGSNDASFDIRIRQQFSSIENYV